MKTAVLKFPLFIALLVWAALAPRPASAQLPPDSYTINIKPGTNLIANHLDSGDNTLNQVLPVVASGSQLLKWDEASQTFHTDDYPGPLIGWIDSSGLPSTTTLGVREAAFLVNPGTTAYLLTISGNPRTNGPPPPLSRGAFHYVSRATKGTATFADFYCCNPTDDCSLGLRWNATTQSWLTNMFTACHWSPVEPTAAVGEGMVIWLPPVAQPLVVCPPDLTVFGCDPETPVSYRASYGTNRWISCFPPSGTLFARGTSNVTCTATNDCGTALSNSFKVTVRTPVARWPWPSPVPGIGIPVEPVGGATVVYPPAGSSSTGGPALEFIPNAVVPDSGIRLKPGPAQAITFTTVMDFNAPEGSGIDLAVPSSDPANPTNAILLSLKKGTNKTVVIQGTGFGNNPDNLCAIAVNTNGNLLPELTFTSSERATNPFVIIGAQPGVSNCHITVELNLLDGGLKVEWDGPIVPSATRKGWDGCIYGPDRPIKKGQARLYVGPPPFPGIPPGTELFIHATGLSEVIIEDASLTQGGRKWGDGHITLMKAYDDGPTARGVEFTPLADGGGVTIDTGYSASFDVRLLHLANGDSPGTEELLTRTIGPIRGLTNRPPPPFLDAMRFKASSLGGVECSADFSNLGSPTVLVQVLDHGVIVAERAGVPATLGDPILILPDWPARLGKLGGATPCRRGKPPILGAFTLTGGGLGLPDQTVMGDEFRVLAELAPAAPHPDYYSGFELLGSAGATWAVTQLQTTSALSPPTATITAGPDGLTIDGATEGFGYLGATSVTGPFYDLGVVASAVTGTNTTPIKLPPLRESPSLIFNVRESPTRCCRGGNPY